MELGRYVYRFIAMVVTREAALCANSILPGMGRRQRLLSGENDKCNVPDGQLNAIWRYQNDLVEDFTHVSCH